MPNHPYTDPEHPYSGSGPRYQNNYNSSRRWEDFQFPWWAIIIGFMTWWPLGFIFLFVNDRIKKGGLPDPSRFRQNRDGGAMHLDPQPIYAQPSAGAQESAPKKSKKKSKKTQTAPAGETGGRERWLYIIGAVLAAVGAMALPDALYWLPDALGMGGHYWSWLLEEAIPPLLMLAGGAGCLFAAQRSKTGRRLRRKIANIVGDAPYMYIEDIAAAIPCDYEKCCDHLERCIDKGVFGESAYLDMRTRSLVVRGDAPQPAATPAPAPKEEAAERDRYQQVLDELRRVNDAIPDREMSGKISRLEQVSAKIFAQAKEDPEKLPQIRKFMDYYLPTALKLLKTYAELDAQGVEGDNIRESKQRIEQVMDTLVVAFENQLDKMFQADALDVSTDIDVMQNMLRADGLADDGPFRLDGPSSPELKL